MLSCVPLPHTSLDQWPHTGILGLSLYVCLILLATIQEGILGHDAANCILIEVKNLDETLKYNLTFFVTTGTIRAQGNQYRLFTDKHFPTLVGQRQFRASVSVILYIIWCDR
jgi:hypothetical protein